MQVKEVISVYRFTPPNKYKHAYIFFNITIIISIIVTAALFHDHIEIFGIPIALWWLFNGLWSVNSNWYSWFHRNDKSSSSHGFWLICLISGIAMSILLFIIHLLMWCRTPFLRFYPCLDTFYPQYRIKKRTFVYQTKVPFLNDVCLRQMMTTSPNDVCYANDVCLAAHYGKHRIIATNGSNIILSEAKNIISP